MRRACRMTESATCPRVRGRLGLDSTRFSNIARPSFPGQNGTAFSGNLLPFIISLLSLPHPQPRYHSRAGYGARWGYFIIQYAVSKFGVSFSAFSSSAMATSVVRRIPAFDLSSSSRIGRTSIRSASGSILGTFTPLLLFFSILKDSIQNRLPVKSRRKVELPDREGRDLHQRFRVRLGEEFEHVPAAGAADALGRVAALLVLGDHRVFHHLHRRFSVCVPTPHAQSF